MLETDILAETYSNLHTIKACVSLVFHRPVAKCGHQRCFACRLQSKKHRLLRQR